MTDEVKSLPRHVGIIMDGNGRWATAKGKKRSFGHSEGSKNVDRIVSYAFERGIHALTLYVFSSENWSRPKQEVDKLMSLLKVYIKKFVKKAVKNKTRLMVVGDVSGLSNELQELIATDMEKTSVYSDHILNLAINYGGRQEIVNAVNTIIKNGEEVTIDNISKNLYTAVSGEPDLIIRTGGEFRLSNFLLFQGAYSELYFTDVLWPDFDENEFDKAIESFTKRERRFGNVK